MTPRPDAEQIHAGTPPAPGTAPPTADREPGLGEWLRSNGPTLLILSALFAFLYIKFDADGLWAIAKAAIGLGLVIFVHELGHFLVAKWCDVHVTTFSIGFGPAIPGCHWQWGETTYKLAIFPLGGYVQMVGQVDGDESTDEGAVEDPRSYRNKSVGQRMAIISAGVVMNVILAIVCFIVVFQGPGKDRKAAVVNAIDTGSPAYAKGLLVGSEIEQIGDVKAPYFEDLMVTVMATTRGEELKLVYVTPQGQTRTIDIEPRKTASDDRPMLGIQPADALQLKEERFFPSEFKTPTLFGSAAARATPPFAFGDVIVAMSDPDKNGAVTELRWDPRKTADEGGKQRDYFDFVRRMRVLAGKPVVVRVERADPSGGKRQIDITVPPAFHVTYGARMQMGQITAVRESPRGARAAIQKRDPEKSRDGDVIELVVVKGADGNLIAYGDPKALADPAKVDKALLTLPAYRPLDPVRLPSQLRAWAEQVKDRGDAQEVTLVLRRHDQQNGGPVYVSKTVTLPWDATYQDNTELPMNVDSPLSIPGLGIGYRVKRMVAAAEPGSPFKADDVIKRYRFEALVDSEGKKDKGSWADLEDRRAGKVLHDQWARVSLVLQSPGITSIDFEVERNGKTVEFTVAPKEVKDWPAAKRGLLLMPDQRRQRADGIVDAVLLGLKDTRNSMVQVFQNLRGMVTGRISVENLGGPITIGRVAYYFAGLDFWEFVFFLGLISINLAVINFLPIPVLDGGHMVFLLYEKIRGKPASEGVRVGATYAGLLLLASLMIFVLFLDIKRLL